MICPASFLPELKWSTEVVGQVSAKAAAETGLAAGTPVTAGTCDAAAEAVSAGVVSPGDTMLMYGSTIFLVKICEALPQTGTLWPAVFLEPNSYALAAGMATGGAITRWFRDQFGQSEIDLEERVGKNAYASLAEMAAQVPPGAGGLLALPYFSGERTPIHDPLARGIIAGLTLRHSRSQLYRALLEGVAYGIRHNLEALAEHSEQPAKLVAIGGGAKNRTWLQIVSDVVGQTQWVPESPGASYGDALLAGVAVGILEDLRAVQEWLGEPGLVTPDPDAHAIYDKYYALYREFYPATREVAHSLARLGE
jgi:xylulokinase